jgi:hypothetical protein
MALLQGSVIGPAGDRVWEAFGGGPADLLFVDAFLGEWLVQSTLIKLETPLGEDMVPDMRVRLSLFVASALEA